MNVFISPTYTIFYHHLVELKLRFIYIILSFFLSFFICYYYCFQVIYIFAKPFLQYTNKFMFTNLTEALYTSIEISFLCSLFLTIPLGLYQFWCFFIPSKFKNERQKVNFTFVLIFIFFAGGVSFVYLFFLPKLYEFLLNFQISTHLLHIELQARIQSYAKLACKIFMFFTFFFQLPLIFLFLVKHNYIKLNFLFTNRKKIFFIVLIICSVVSPPDVFSQFSITLLIIIFLEILFFTGYLYEKKLTSHNINKIF